MKKKYVQTPVKSPVLVKSCTNERYIMDGRIRADRHVFAFQGNDPQQGGLHEWRCSFWVKRGSPIPKPKHQYETKQAAIEDGKLKGEEV